MSHDLHSVDAVRRVTAGSNWLDGRYPEWQASGYVAWPGPWWKRVPLTISDLVMSNPNRCVIAHVTAHSFLDVIPHIMTADDALRYGFTGGYGVTSTDLRKAWHSEVLARLHATEAERVRGLLASAGITSTGF